MTMTSLSIPMYCILLLVYLVYLLVRLVAITSHYFVSLNVFISISITQNLFVLFIMTSLSSRDYSLVTNWLITIMCSFPFITSTYHLVISSTF